MRVSLDVLGAEETCLEESFNEQKRFIESISSANGDRNIVMLNVSGTIMATKRAIFQIVEDSALAQQLDDTKWTVQGSLSLFKAWTPNQ
jgi:ClpP class serine protease